MLRATRSLVSSETGRLPLSTYDTVLAATPACRATSASVAIRYLPDSPAPVEALRVSLNYHRRYLGQRRR